MIETLFFLCYYAYLDGDLVRARMFFEIMKEEYRANPQATMDKHYLRMLNEVKLSLKANQILRPIESVTNANRIDGSENSQGADQKDLVKRICSVLGALSDILGSKGLEVQNIEHPCPPFGAVDILCGDGEYAYPIEVKTGMGKHDVIGQISKYELYCRRNLHLKFYRDVQPVTICAGYQEFALAELKKLGVVPIVHRSVNGTVKLSRA